MDFSALKAIQSQTQNLSQEREVAAHKAYQEGLQLFQAYNQNPDKASLKQAMQKMLKSIQLKRTYLEPYLMMANVYKALEVPQQASKYFRLAQHLAPQDKRVAMLREAFSQATHTQTIQKTSQKTVDSAAEYDQLFYEVEDVLQGELATYLSTLDLPHVPDDAPDVIQRLEKYLLELKFYGMEIELKIQLIEEELDTLVLKAQYRSFEAQRKQIMLLHSQCLQFHGLKAQLDETYNQIKHAKMTANPQQLDTILDACDAFADQLDALSEKGICIDALHPAYQLLIEEVTKWQELLDDSA